MEHYVLNQLREDKDFVRELDIVMEQEGKIIGQNIFVKAIIKADDGRDIPILTMGPICILPELKRQGYGKVLLDYSLEKQQNSVLVQYASKEISTFMERAVSPLPVCMASVITGYRRGPMLLSFSAKS